jgi:hypothetical protein
MNPTGPIGPRSIDAFAFAVCLIVLGLALAGPARYAGAVGWVTVQAFSLA